MPDILSTLPLGASLDIFTDGACIGNPGPAGYGFVVVYDGEPIHTGSAYIGLGTNNIAELTAAIEALRTLQPLDGRARPDVLVAIHSDSKYVIDGMTKWLAGWKANGWKNANRKPVANRDLWQTLDGLASALPGLRWQWVKAHNGHRFNEMADGLASDAATHAQEVA